jgi:hypothetical protein
LLKPIHRRARQRPYQTELLKKQAGAVYDLKCRRLDSAAARFHAFAYRRVSGLLRFLGVRVSVRSVR